jgi:hypothetical protein
MRDVTWKRLREIAQASVVYHTRSLGENLGTFTEGTFDVSGFIGLLLNEEAKEAAEPTLDDLLGEAEKVELRRERALAVLAREEAEQNGKPK